MGLVNLEEMEIDGIVAIHREQQTNEIGVRPQAKESIVLYVVQSRSWRTAPAFYRR